MAYVFFAFLSGFVVMGLEMSTARLIAPYFGSSMPVWSVIISLFLLSISTGYMLGGKVSVRSATVRLLGYCAVIAGGVIGLMTLVARALLGQAAGLDFGPSMLSGLPGFLSVAVLSAVPVIALSMIPPIAIRVGVSQVSNAGAVAGKVHAMATAGSLFGTLLVSLLVLPGIGTKACLYSLAALCIVPGLIPLRRKLVLAAALFIVLAVALVELAFSRNAPERDNVVWRGETLYAHAFVETGSRGVRLLKYDAGWATQSIYDPEGPSSGGSWPMFLTAGQLRNPCDTPPEDALIIGLAAGTLARDLEFAYDGMRTVGVEIDEQVVALGRDMFGLPPRTEVHITDGRHFLSQTADDYDYIFIDAYKDIYLPPHLATREFFGLARQKLKPGGVVAANVLAYKDEDSLARTVAATMQTVFDHVSLLRTSRDSMNVLLFAWDGPALQEQLSRSCALPRHLSQAQLVRRFSRQLRSFTDRDLQVLTDDRAQVEYFTHRIVAEILLGEG